MIKIVTSFVNEKNLTFLQLSSKINQRQRQKPNICLQFYKYFPGKKFFILYLGYVLYEAEYTPLWQQ